MKGSVVLLAVSNDSNSWTSVDENIISNLFFVFIPANFDQFSKMIGIFGENNFILTNKNFQKGIQGLIFWKLSALCDKIPSFFSVPLKTAEFDFSCSWKYAIKIL